MSKIADYMAAHNLSSKELGCVLDICKSSTAKLIKNGVVYPSHAKRIAALLGCAMAEIWEGGDGTSDDPMTWDSDTPGMRHLLDVLTNDMAFTAFTGKGLPEARRKWRHIGRNWKVTWNDPRRQGL